MTKKSPVKVLPICSEPSAKANGVATYCHSLADLFKDDQRVAVLSPLESPFKVSKLMNYRFKWGPLYRKLKQSDADILHINGYTSLDIFQALWAAALLRKKVVYTPHWHPYGMLRRPLLAKMAFQLFVRPVLNRVRAVVTLNQDDTAYFASMGDKVHRIPHWRRFQVSDELLHLPKQDNMILFIGRFNADNKGFDYLYHLPEGKYDIHCVGRGTVEKRSDMTLHTGIPTEELMRLYAKASLVVIPSKYEAFSYVALEALSMNTPVLMSDRVRIGDYVKDCRGVDIFRYGDYEAFVNQVATHIGTEVDRDGILSIFDPAAIREKYVELYQEAAQ